MAATSAATSAATMVIPVNRSAFSTGINFRQSTPGDFVCLYNQPIRNKPAVLFMEVTPSINSAPMFTKLNKYGTFINNLVYNASINEYELPTENVKDCAVTLLSLFEVKHISGATILPLREGGIGFEFTKDQVYYNIQIDNEGDAVLYKEEPNQAPKGWDLNFQHLLRNLKTEFNGM